MGDKYRISVFGRPRTGWRDTFDEALQDAVTSELASWDGERQEWFLAVPVTVDRRSASI